MKKIKLIPFCMLLGVLFVLSACEEEEIMTYDASKAAVNFSGSSFGYSFLTNPNNEHVQEVEVNIVGDTVSYDRNFNVEIVDSMTTASVNQYEVLEGTVKAGGFDGTLSVKLYNSEELADTTVTVGFKLVDSEDFEVGTIENSQFKLSFTDDVVVPAWSYMRYFFCSTSSTSCYRIFVQVTGLTQFTITEYKQYGAAGTSALATKFGDYIKQWNLEHPDNHLKHDDGTKAGEDIIPLYYTHSKYD